MVCADVVGTVCGSGGFCCVRGCGCRVRGGACCAWAAQANNSAAARATITESCYRFMSDLLVGGELRRSNTYATPSACIHDWKRAFRVCSHSKGSAWIAQKAARTEMPSPMQKLPECERACVCTQKSVGSPPSCRRAATTSPANPEAHCTIHSIAPKGFRASENFSQAHAFVQLVTRRAVHPAIRKRCGPCRSAFPAAARCRHRCAGSIACYGHSPVRGESCTPQRRLFAPCAQKFPVGPAAMRPVRRPRCSGVPHPSRRACPEDLPDPWLPPFYFRAVAERPQHRQAYI